MAKREWKVGDPNPSPREIIMRAISRPGIDLVLHGYAPLCKRIEDDLHSAGFTITKQFED